MMKLPTAGQTLYFPAVQECQQGTHRWIEIPAVGQKRDDLREPWSGIAYRVQLIRPVLHHLKCRADQLSVALATKS
jgi:hypothetical protein